MYIHSETTKQFNKEFSTKYNQIKNIGELDITWENRDKLIYSLTPMMRKIVYDRAKMITTTNIETIDIIGAGSEGLVRGVDVYISRAVNDGVEHTAKISTFVHFYINKYISNFVNESVSILTCSERSLEEALKQRPTSLNIENKKQNGSVECESEEINVIDLHFSQTNIGILDTLNAEHNFNDNKAIILDVFKNIKKNDKKMLLFFFGIGLESKMSISDIAKYFGYDESKVSKRIKSTIEQLKINMDKRVNINSDIKSVLNFPEKIMEFNFIN